MRHFCGEKLGLIPVFLLGVVSAGSGMQTVDYYSPHNAERPQRKRTDFIILHTTEGPEAGSLKKIHHNGEAHFFVNRGGRIYRVVDRNRVAFHAGRSMWNGKANIDEYSIGIEIAGYYNRDITGAQYDALRELIDFLQRTYKIPDERVLTHCMVAYGSPNRWHRRSHRGRKRCGMLLATAPVRRRLGLETKPAYDPDVRSGRLVVGDQYLAEVLYGGARLGIGGKATETPSGDDMIGPNQSAWDIARDRYDSPHTTYVLPSGDKLRGNEVKDWKKIPPGTRVILTEERDNESENARQLGADGSSAAEIAGDEYNAGTTIYFMADGRVKKGSDLSDAEFKSLAPGTKVLVGYVWGGRIKAKRSAFDVCGDLWDSPATFYRFPDGRIVSGADISEGAIPRNTMVFFRN